MDLSPKRRKAQELMDHAIMAIMEAAMAAGIEPNWLVEPMMQKAAHLAASAAIMGKPVNVENLLKNFPVEVSEATKAVLSRVQ